MLQAVPQSGDFLRELRKDKLRKMLLFYQVTPEEIFGFAFS
jgi:hypothetical protein